MSSLAKKTLGSGVWVLLPQKEGKGMIVYSVGNPPQTEGSCLAADVQSHIYAGASGVLQCSLLVTVSGSGLTGVSS